jgi:peroxiredoxin
VGSLAAYCMTLLAASSAALVADRSTAPDFQLWNSSGGRTQLSELRGSIVVLNFWATWCAPCRHEVPVLNRIHERYSGRGVAVIGVAMDDRGWPAVAPFVAQHRVSYPVLLGTPKVARAYGGVRTLPLTVFIDRDGRIVATHDQMLSEKQLEEVLDVLIASSGTQLVQNRTRN